MKTTILKKESVPQKWWIVDADDRILGRLATRLATVLMGKHRPDYTPHVDGGDYIVVTNAVKVKLSGNKRETKTYVHYSGYPSGRKEVSIKDILDTKPEFIIMEAVRRMLPKNTLGRNMLKKLKVYADDKHPHVSQNPKKLDV